MFDDDSDIPIPKNEYQSGESVTVEKRKCEDCGHNSQQVWYNAGRDNYTSHCYHCDEQKGDPYNGGKAGIVVAVKTPEEKMAEAMELTECPLFGEALNNPYRGIPPSFFNSWRIRLLFSEYDGKTPYAVGFPYTAKGGLCGYKIRLLKLKKFWAVGRTKHFADMFGLERALKIGGDTLYITEGELDAIALDYALCTVLGGDGYAVVSLTNGGGTILDDLRQVWSKLNRFKRIVLVLDNDEVGLNAQRNAQLAYDKVLIGAVPDGCKDSNDAVKQHKMTELVSLIQHEATRTLEGWEDEW